MLVKTLLKIYFLVLCTAGAFADQLSNLPIYEKIKIFDGLESLNRLTRPPSPSCSVETPSSDTRKKNFDCSLPIGSFAADIRLLMNAFPNEFENYQRSVYDQNRRKVPSKLDEMVQDKYQTELLRSDDSLKTFITHLIFPVDPEHLEKNLQYFDEVLARIESFEGPSIVDREFGESSFQTLVDFRRALRPIYQKLANKKNSLEEMRRLHRESVNLSVSDDSTLDNFNKLRRENEGELFLYTKSGIDFILGNVPGLGAVLLSQSGLTEGFKLRLFKEVVAIYQKKFESFLKACKEGNIDREVKKASDGSSLRSNLRVDLTKKKILLATEDTTKEDLTKLPSEEKAPQLLHFDEKIWEGSLSQTEAKKLIKRSKIVDIAPLSFSQLGKNHGTKIITFETPENEKYKFIMKCDEDVEGGETFWSTLTAQEIAKRTGLVKIPFTFRYHVKHGKLDQKCLLQSFIENAYELADVISVDSSKMSLPMKIFYYLIAKYDAHMSNALAVRGHLEISIDEENSFNYEGMSVNLRKRVDKDFTSSLEIFAQEFSTLLEDKKKKLLDKLELLANELEDELGFTKTALSPRKGGGTFGKKIHQVVESHPPHIAEIFSTKTTQSKLKKNRERKALHMLIVMTKTRCLVKRLNQEEGYEQFCKDFEKKLEEIIGERTADLLTMEDLKHPDLKLPVLVRVKEKNKKKLGVATRERKIVIIGPLNDFTVNKAKTQISFTEDAWQKIQRENRGLIAAKPTIFMDPTKEQVEDFKTFLKQLYLPKAVEGK